MGNAAWFIAGAILYLAASTTVLGVVMTASARPPGRWVIPVWYAAAACFLVWWWRVNL